MLNLKEKWRTRVFKCENTCNNCWKGASNTVEVGKFRGSCCARRECYWARLEINTAFIYRMNEFRSELIGNRQEKSMEKTLKSRWISQNGTKKCKM
jgi:hypothetical protein